MTECFILFVIVIQIIYTLIYVKKCKIFVINETYTIVFRRWFRIKRNNIDKIYIVYTPSNLLFCGSNGL